MGRTGRGYVRSKKSEVRNIWQEKTAGGCACDFLWDSVVSAADHFRGNTAGRFGGFREVDIPVAFDGQIYRVQGNTHCISVRNRKFILVFFHGVVGGQGEKGRRSAADGKENPFTVRVINGNIYKTDAGRGYIFPEIPG